MADPRGRFLYVGHSNASPGGIGRINIDSTDVNYGKITHITAGINSNWGVTNLTLSDGGDRLYAAVGRPSSGYFTGVIHEYDTAQNTVLRTWNMNGRYKNLYKLAVR